jgi:hypothetical protein
MRSAVACRPASVVTGHLRDGVRRAATLAKGIEDPLEFGCAMSSGCPLDSSAAPLDSRAAPARSGVHRGESRGRRAEVPPASRLNTAPLP